jgi:hypothetical protein
LDQIDLRLSDRSCCVKHWRKGGRGEIRLLATVWRKMDILWPKVREDASAIFAVSSVHLE